jgi:hypothetical protein
LPRWAGTVLLRISASHDYRSEPSCFAFFCYYYSIYPSYLFVNRVSQDYLFSSAVPTQFC